MSQPAGRVVITRIGVDATTVMLFGSIDSSAEALVDVHLTPMVDAQTPLRLDLSQVIFMDSVGARPLLDAARRLMAAGVSFQIVGWSSAVDRFRDALQVIAEESDGRRRRDPNQATVPEGLVPREGQAHGPASG